MSELNVKVVKIEIFEHDNADKLSVARFGGVGGYECVVTKDEFQNGELAIYIPPDSVLPDNILDYQKEHKNISIPGGRIRAIKIRGQLSEGLCLKPSQWLEPKDIVEDNDVTDILGIKKYEPPPPSSNVFKSAKGVNSYYQNDNFVKYNCVEHFKKYPNIFNTDEQVVVTTKFHGTNHRVALVDKPNYKKSLWSKLKNLIIKEDPKEFLVGSHSKIRYLTENAIKNNAQDTDLYWRATKQYELEEAIRSIAELNKKEDGTLPDVAIYSEIIGHGIQKNYNYGIPEGSIAIKVFDIMVDKKYLDWNAVKILCIRYALPMVDELYVGKWNTDLLKLAEAVDEYARKKCNREGIVIRPAVERKAKCGRVIMKYINPKYLLDKNNTDFH